MPTPRRWFLAQFAATLAVAPAVSARAGHLLAPLRPDPAPDVDLRPDPDLDRLAQQAVAEARPGPKRAPGLVAALVHRDRRFGSAADGVRKLGAPDRVTTADLFHLGSCTKAMTATMLGALVERRQLRWESTLGEVFAAEANAMHADYRGATLDQLLRHRAGLPANVDWWQVDRAGGTLAEQRRSLARTVLQRAPSAAPGTKFLYSNLGYTLAAAMAEVATGSPWEDLIQQHVGGPLGMRSLGFGPPGRAEAVDQPWGHRAVGPLLTPTRIDNPPVMSPAGRVHLSVADWARFALFHLGDGTVAGRRLLRPETLQYLHDAPVGQDYAAGWIVARPERPGADLTWQHGGSNTVWFAYIILAPRRGVAALVAGNAASDAAQTACVEAARTLAAL